MEEIEMVLDMAKEGMAAAIEHLKKGLGKIRAGRAHSSMLDGIYVDYYGTNTPLSQVSNINTPDGRTMSIQPWEKAMLEPIERAIMMANIGRRTGVLLWMRPSYPSLCVSVLNSFAIKPNPKTDPEVQARKPCHRCNPRSH